MNSLFRYATSNMLKGLAIFILAVSLSLVIGGWCLIIFIMWALAWVLYIPTFGFSRKMYWRIMEQAYWR